MIENLSLRAALCGAWWLGAAGLCSAENGNTIVLDCTNSCVASDLTGKLPTVYQGGANFDAAAFSGNGEIPRKDFETLARTGLKKPKGVVRFKITKGDIVDIYVVTSIRMDTSNQAVALPDAPLQWVSDPMTWVSSRPSRSSGPATTVSQPITLSILRTARFLLKEQQRPTALESGGIAKASSLFGVTFKESKLVPSPSGESPPAPTVYYYYLEKYKLKFENSVLTLSFEDQKANQLNVETLMTGKSENWFLMAGGPLAAYNLDSGTFGNNPLGLYVGLNWTPNDIFDPGMRLLIVNLLDVNTTNPASSIGLIGLGMGFPKMNEFIPLSTLSVTETLVYNMSSSNWQLLTMFNYDATDLLQFLKL